MEGSDKKSVRNRPGTARIEKGQRRRSVSAPKGPGVSAAIMSPSASGLGSLTSVTAGEAEERNPSLYFSEYTGEISFFLKVLPKLRQNRNSVFKIKSKFRALKIRRFISHSLCMTYSNFMQMFTSKARLFGLEFKLNISQGDVDLEHSVITLVMVLPCFHFVNGRYVSL